MKSIVLFVVAAFMFLAVDHAYGMGGGGHSGDGRIDFSRSAGNGDGSPASSNSQGAPNASNGNAGGAGNSLVLTGGGGNVPGLLLTVPEPVTLFLLGFGIVGLVGLRRKYSK